MPRKLLTHVRNTHRYDPRFRFQCSLCYITLNSYRMLLKHLQKKHEISMDGDHGIHAAFNEDITSENKDTQNGKLHFNYRDIL